MRRDTGPEAVFDKHFGPAQEGKRGFIDDKVEIACFLADRTVTIEQFDCFQRLNSETYRAAVATAGAFHSTVTDLARLRG